MNKKKHRKILWLLVLLVIAGVLIGGWYLRTQMQPQTKAVSSHTVSRGDVSVTITGSGMLETRDTTDVLLPEGVEVETIFVEKGDVVQQGDVLAKLDSASLQYRAAELSAELTALDKQLGTRRLSSNITAPVKGRIKYLPVSEEDDVVEAVNLYGALAILSTDGLMQVELPTESVLSLNAEVKVKWNGGSEEGKVASRIENGYLITLDDADAPYKGNADVYYDAALVGSGTLEIHAPLAVFGNGGTIDGISYDLDDMVNANATLFTLDNEPAVDSYRQTLADRNEKAQQLQVVLAYQKQPNVIAGVSGTVNDVLVTEGKKTVSSDGTAEVTAFVLGTGGATKMSIDVDELDSNSVALGQTAQITLDAFASESFVAQVTRISHIGEPSGSITTYQTDLELVADDRLKTGMNGSAVILSDTVSNVLVIPLGAIHEDADGSYVYLLNSENEQTKRYIITGLSDGSYAEVVSGLNEGDRIAYAQARSNFFMPFMMPGAGEQGLGR